MWWMRGLILSLCLPAYATSPLPDKAELIYEDNFDHLAVREAWLLKTGKWEVRDGALYGENGAYLVLKKDVGSDMRVEYTTWSAAPDDLSVCLGCDLEKSAPNGVYFQCGVNQNGETWIKNTKTTRVLWKSEADNPLQTGVRHRIVCQIIGDNIWFWVDDKLLYFGADPQLREAVAGFTVGFFIGAAGYIDNVRIYRLSADIPEPALEVSDWRNFDDGKTRDLPPGFSLLRGDPGSVTVVNFPDYVSEYKTPYWSETHWARNGCLRLLASADGAATRPAVQYAFKPLRNGLIEVELLCLPDSGDVAGAFEIDLLDESGAIAGSFMTDAQACFIFRDRAGADTELKKELQIEPVRRKRLCNFKARRWLRFRIHFDLDRNQCSAALVQLYTSTKPARKPAENPGFPRPVSDWLELGAGLPLSVGAGGRLVGLSLSAVSPGELFADNLYVVGPVNGYFVGGQDQRLPARQLLQSSENPRNDPPDNKIYSLRRPWSFPYPKEVDDVIRTNLPFADASDVLKAAGLYNALLVDLAYLEIDARRIERGLAYINNGNVPLPVDVAQRARMVQSDVASLDQAVNGLYKMYVSAYVDGLNETILRNEFMPMAEYIRRNTARIRADVRQALSAMGVDVNADEEPRSLVMAGEATGKDWRRSLVFAQNGCCFWPEQDRLLKLGNYDTFKAQIGSWSSPDDGRYFKCVDISQDMFFDKRPEVGLFIPLIFGLHFCYTAVPLWWLEQHAEDDDVFFCEADGSLPSYNGKRWRGYFGKMGRAQLNFWNTDVQQMSRDSALELAGSLANRYPGKTLALQLMAEAKNSLGKSFTGHNRSAAEAFRRKLRAQYGVIEKLNQIWGSDYTAFDAIIPPMDFSATPRPYPSGLGYEWELFRQEGYRNWMRIIIQALKEKLPDVPVATGLDGTGGVSPHHGFDLSGLLAEFDVYDLHTSRGEKRRYPSRILSSLKRALGGRAGILEWSPLTPGDRFDEVAGRRIGEMEFFRLAADGRSFFRIWYGVMPGWDDNANWPDIRWGYTTLRYSAMSIPVSITRLRNYERYLMLPLVAPNINIMESTASFLNAYPHDGVRSQMSLYADLLDQQGLDYGILWENLILGGKQMLAHSAVVLLPNAICLPDAMQQKLLDWMRDGGVLIAFGAPGVFDPWGKRSGSLLKAAFDGAEWCGDSQNGWMPDRDLAEYQMGKYAPSGLIYQASVGKGKLVFFSQLMDAKNPGQAEERMLQYVRDNAAPRFYCRNNKIELTLRNDALHGRWYMTALNAERFPEEWETVEDEILVRGSEMIVCDVELPGIPVPTRMEGNATVFKVKLAAGEGIILEMSPPNKKQTSMTGAGAGDEPDSMKGRL